jgi:hypothetical protein
LSNDADNVSFLSLANTFSLAVTAFAAARFATLYYNLLGMPSPLMAMPVFVIAEPNHFPHGSSSSLLAP